MRAIALGFAVILAASALGAGGAAQPKVFDRTLICFAGDGGPQISGAPVLDRSHPGGVGLTGTRTGGDNWFLVSAGTHYPTLLSAVAVDDEHCRRTANRVPLSREGLPGPPLGIGAVRCPAGRVLARIRYTYVPGPRPPSTEIGGRLLSAALAVRSYRTLRPLAFVSLTDSGRKLRLYSSAACRIS
jgi:hypothetical protein